MGRQRETQTNQEIEESLSVWASRVLRQWDKQIAEEAKKIAPCVGLTTLQVEDDLRKVLSPHITISHLFGGIGMK